MNTGDRREENVGH
jgi:hypothetical protein